MAIFSSHSKSSSHKSDSHAKSYTDPMHPDYRKPAPIGLRTFTAICYLLSLVFLILVCIGNINDKPVIRSTYFLTINLSNIIPESVPNAVLINSVARSIGLHDFYQVGLWNFCEGYNDQGITSCTKPKTLYWFNPVEIILDELLNGATIALPTELVTVLRLVRIASHWMFGAFIAGTCLTFTCIFLAPLGFSSRPRWSHRGRRIFLREIPLIIWTFLTLLLTAGASVIATVMYVIFQNTFRNNGEVNIGASLGKPMLAFMWTAVGFNLIGFLVQFGTCCGVCCCTGRKKAMRRSQAINGYGNGNGVSNEHANDMTEKQKEKASMNSGRKRRFGFRSNE